MINKQKAKIIALTFGLIIFITGVYILSIELSSWSLFGLMLIIWANNIGEFNK